MIDVVRDSEGVRKAIEELLEEDLARSRLEAQLGSGRRVDPRTKERMLAQVPRRTLSPGYYRWAERMLALEAERKAGVPMDPRMPAYEAEGLLAAERARNAFNSEHPACGGCGTRQPNRFGVECAHCGAKFARKRR